MKASGYQIKRKNDRKKLRQKPAQKTADPAFLRAGYDRWIRNKVYYMKEAGRRRLPPAGQHHFVWIIPE